MASTQILNANLIFQADKIELINAKVKHKNGKIYIKAILDRNVFKTHEDITEKLKLKSGVHKINMSTLPYIQATTMQSSEITFHKIGVSHLSYDTLKVKFHCHSFSEEKIKDPYRNNIKTFNGVTYKGVSILHEKCTTIKKTRVINDKIESRPESTKFDHTESVLKFNYDQKLYELKILFSQNKNPYKTNLRILEPNLINYPTYKMIQTPLRAFLSFVSGNNIEITEESYQDDQFIYIRKYPTWETREINEQKYIPINNIHLGRTNKILEEYLSCFDNYLFIDKQLDLTNFIFIFNESRNFSIDTAIFSMLVCIEMLSEKYINSIFYNSEASYYIETEKYHQALTRTEQQFIDDIGPLTKGNDIHTLKSKLKNLNKKGKTDKKITALLEFSQVTITPEIEDIFPKIRNYAFHEGRPESDKTSSYEAYKALTELIYEMICNIIQYKGTRVIKTEGMNIYSVIKETYNINYSAFKT